MASFSFNNEMCRAFGADNGAYSPVTRDEFNKSQITLVGPEQELAEAFLGARLANHHGSAKTIRAEGHDPEIIFRLHPTGRPINLTLSYKTGKPRELRLYLRADAFKPLPGENWCIFVRNSELWIGQLGDWLAAEAAAGKLPEAGMRLLPEEEIDNFQDALNGSLPEQVASMTMGWKRNPKIAAAALKMSGYVCELEPAFPVFVSKGSGKPFLEAHHLVPMKVQGDFGARSLDVVENVCILNPLVHRRLHHATLVVIAPDLERLIATRKPFLDGLGLLVDDVLRLYD